MSETIQDLLNRVGSNAYDAADNGDGTANVEMTAAQASKLSELLGKDNVSFVSLTKSHVIIRVSLAALETAAKENQKTARGASVQVEITSRMVYAVDAPEAKNEVTRAWWESATGRGGIMINGAEFEIFAGVAADYYEEPEDENEAKEWNPERVVYVIELPSDKGELALTSYGITNLIRRVCARTEAIG